MPKKKSRRGGARPGAGRPPVPEKEKSKTKVIRVPLEIADQLHRMQDILALIEDYNFRSQDASPSSPRWEQWRKFHKELEDLTS